MEDRTIVITGASSGIGRAAARELALLGAQVAVVGRDPDRTRATADEVGGRAYLADYSRLESVRQLADRLLSDLPRIHVLANNAGGIRQKRERTADGNEQTFQQNHLGGFLLTNLLLDRLRETAMDAPVGSVRIIQTSSDANAGARIRMEDLDSDRGPWLLGWRAYGRSKLENILFTRELARRLTGTAVSAYAFHPGFVSSGFGNGGMITAFAARVALSSEQGAMPLVRLVATPTIAAPSGNYFDRLKAPGRVAAQANSAGLAKALWSASEVLTGLR